MFSAGAHSRAAVEALLAAGANARAKDDEGHAVRVHATDAVHSKDAEIDKLLLAHRAHVDSRDSTGSTPIILAAPGGNAKDLKALMAVGADLDVRDNEGRTGLGRALKRAIDKLEGHEQVIWLRKETGARQ